MNVKQRDALHVIESAVINARPQKYVAVELLQATYRVSVSTINALVTEGHLTKRQGETGPEVAITAQLGPDELPPKPTKPTPESKQPLTPDEKAAKWSEAGRKAAITRKANIAKRAAEAAQAAAPKTCCLCGCDKQVRYERSGTIHGGMIPVEHPIEGRYCDTCRAGLDSGEFAAVGVQHEMKAARNEWAFGCHPDMVERLKQHRLETATGWIALPPFMPRVGHGMTGEAALKAHKKAAANRPAKQEPEQQAA